MRSERSAPERNRRWPVRRACWATVAGVQRSVSTEDLGAWLIKGNADQADLPGRFDPRHGRWSVPMSLVVLPAERRVRREHLRADVRLAGIEVLRQPQAANPSFLSVAQFAAVSEHLEALSRD